MAKSKVPAQKRSKPKSAQPFVFTPIMRNSLIAAGVLIVALIVFFQLRYHMAALPLDAEGKITMPDGQHWLVYNEKTTSNPRYIKLGSVDAGEGYTLRGAEFVTDPNVQYYTFEPTASSDNPLVYRAIVAQGSYKDVPANVSASLASMLVDGKASEIVETNMAGRNVSYYFCDGMREATTSDAKDVHTKAVYGYVDVSSDRSVSLSVEQTFLATGDPNYAPDEDFLAVLELAVAGVKLG